MNWRLNFRLNFMKVDACGLRQHGTKLPTHFRKARAIGHGHVASRLFRDLSDSYRACKASFYLTSPFLPLLSVHAELV